MQFPTTTLYNTPAQYARACVASHQYIKDGLPDCDEQMKLIVQAFDVIGGIKTFACCAGHPENNEGNDTFYIAFNVTRSGLDKLFKLYRKFIENLPETDLPDIPFMLEHWLQHHETGLQTAWSIRCDVGYISKNLVLIAWYKALGILQP